MIVGLAILTSGCGSPPPVTDLTVLAAASLSGAFARIGGEFHRERPDVQVRFSFAGSPTLVTQIQEGAPADVIATADQANLGKLVGQGLVAGQPRVFARNRLEIVVRTGNPKQIGSLADLARPSIRVDQCAPGVPCGSYAATVLDKAGVRISPANLESDVKSVVTKVALGEADAGIVYVTDVRDGGSAVEGVAIPDNLNLTAEYPVATLAASKHLAAARAFVDYLLGANGQRALAEHGFLTGD